jgi:hypothetical protein
MLLTYCSYPALYFQYVSIYLASDVRSFFLEYIFVCIWFTDFGPTLFCSLICVCCVFYLAGNLEEDAHGVFPDPSPELLLLATCASRLVVPPACSGYN